MDEAKNANTDNTRQIDLSLVRHCLQKGDTKVALQYCYELLSHDPMNVQALLLGALASRSLGWLDDALDLINRALLVASSQPNILSLLGDVLLLQKRPEQALDALLQAKKLGDISAQTCFNIGSAYLAVDAYNDAKIYFDEALASEPQMAVAHVNKGLVEHSLMNLDAALRCFDAALLIDPGNIDAQWNKSHVLLTLGRYEEGFQLYEARWSHPQVKIKKRKFDSKLWLGQEPLAGKTILLFAEGGFGDTIQFIRYAKLFDPNVRLIIQCQVPLIELVKGMGLGAEVISLGETPQPHDFHCPLMSLPLAFGTNIATIPQFDRYIHPPDGHVKKWSAFLSKLSGPTIGIVARGSNGFSNDKNRSFDLKSLIAQLPQHASYVVLQKDLTDDEYAFIESCENIVAPCEALESFTDTAAICTGLDQVISVDTAVAHLSAALGMPTTVLLPYRPDWRWGAESTTSPWYPDARLIRQTRSSECGDIHSIWHMDCLNDLT